MDTMFFLNMMDLIGTIAFAISGAIVAMRKNMDIFGVNILAVVTATGGGIIRDLIIGNVPPVTFRDPTYVLISCIAANIVFCIGYYEYRNNKTLPMGFMRAYTVMLFWCDTLGLAAFTVNGVYAGEQTAYSENLFLIVFLGVITGVGGGLMRDLFALEMPYIFVKHVYAVAAICGAIIMGAINIYTDHKNSGIIAGFVVIILIRFLAAHYLWNLPRIRPKDGKIS